MVTGLTRYALRSAAVFDDDPVQVLHNLKSVLGQKLGIGRNRLCTVIYGNLTKRDNGFDVDLASGGHPPPLLLVRRRQRVLRRHHRRSGRGYHGRARTSSPAGSISRPGTRLVLYTDGLTEASTGVGRERYDDEAPYWASRNQSHRRRRPKSLAPSTRYSTALAPESRTTSLY